MSQAFFYLVSSEHTQWASNTDPRRIVVRMFIYVIETESIMTSKSVDESVRECDGDHRILVDGLAGGKSSADE